MKNIFFTLLFCLYAIFSHAQSAISAYRIFGKITTVDNQEFKGYIQWGNNNYWIDFFEGQKTRNPYSSYFKPGSGVVFRYNNRTYTQPQTHNFCCRFGNLEQIHPTGDREARIQLKNRQEIILRKGNTNDIGTGILITTENEKIQVKWEHISEITFMQADIKDNFPLNPVYGSVKSSQGIYKGLITWNYNQKRSPEKNDNINIFLNKMAKIIRPQKSFQLLAQERQSSTPFYTNSNILEPLGSILVNMPNTGRAIVPPAQFNELTVIPASELKLLTYDDFSQAGLLKGEVITQNNQTISGTLAYDLDESWNFEVLDGKNNNITYCIPLQYIQSIEPKNYKYSFITLKNGSKLSLGESCDVNQENNGVLVLRENQTPVYIIWSEVKTIILQ